MEEDNVKIGLETHLQLLSESKLFCGCPTSGDGGPNTRVCPTCLGLPGSKPRVNRKVIDMGIKIAKALDCEISETMMFSRKSYFYPDMPKNYQITQYEIPLGKNGELSFMVNGEEKTVRIKRIHLEEDPGKIKHVGGDITSADHVNVDYNRAGVPLCEIVTEPDIESPEMARKFLNNLVNVFEYIGVYDSNSEASIRSDANISTYGEKVEVKNITGRKDIKRAMDYEMKRQEKLEERNEDIVMETRSFDDNSGTTKTLRKKEVEEEYGYIFEPDLTKIYLSEDRINGISKEMPELPHEKRRKYIEGMGLTEEIARSITSDFELAQAYEEMLKDKDPKESAKLISGPVKKVLNYNEINFSGSELTVNRLNKIIEMLQNEEITERGVEMIIREAVDRGGDPEELKEEMDLDKVSGQKIEKDINKIVEEEGEAVEDYRNGKEEALNYLVGKVMESTGGKADPREIRELLKERFGD